MISQSGSFSLSLSLPCPLPRPLSSPRSSSLSSSRSLSRISVTETLSEQDGAVQLSIDVYRTVTSTILWFGGQRTALSTDTGVIDGGVLSITVTAWVAENELPEASAAV